MWRLIYKVPNKYQFVWMDGGYIDGGYMDECKITRT